MILHDLDYQIMIIMGNLIMNDPTDVSPFYPASLYALVMTLSMTLYILDPSGF